jgi:hypothetical protein
MICFAKPLLTEDLYIVQTQEFSVTWLYVRSTYSQETNPTSRQRGCYMKTMSAKVQLQKKIYDRDPQAVGAKTNWLAVHREW